MKLLRKCTKCRRNPRRAPDQRYCKRCHAIAQKGYRISLTRRQRSLIRKLCEAYVTEEVHFTHAEKEEARLILHKVRKLG